jgi:hypothetical protein
MRLAKSAMRQSFGIDARLTKRQDFNECCSLMAWCLKGRVFEPPQLLSVTYREFRTQIQVWRPKAFRVGTRLSRGLRKWKPYATSLPDAKVRGLGELFVYRFFHPILYWNHVTVRFISGIGEVFCGQVRTKKRVRVSNTKTLHIIRGVVLERQKNWPSVLNS